RKRYRFGIRPWSFVILSSFVLGHSSFVTAVRAADPALVVGSKSFTESVILAELVAQLVRRTGAKVNHRAELGGTRLLWNALRQGEIDVYPEYTGTISQEILAGQNVQGEEAIRRALAGAGIRMSRPLGFNN